jgi:hypothetical protein
MFIELTMDNGSIVLNTNHIVSFHVDEETSPSFAKEYTTTIVYIKTIDGVTHANTFFHLEEIENYAGADYFYDKLKKMLNVVDEID